MEVVESVWLRDERFEPDAQLPPSPALRWSRNSEALPGGRLLHGEDLVVEGLQMVAAGEQLAATESGDEERPCGSGPCRCGGGQAAMLIPGFRANAQVVTGIDEGGKIGRQPAHRDVGRQEVDRPYRIAHNPPAFGNKVAFFYHRLAEKIRRAEKGKVAAHEAVESLGIHCGAAANILPAAIGDDGIAENHFCFGVSMKDIGDFSQGARQVLLVGVEPGQNVPRRAAKPAIDGIIHAGICFAVDG
jgi:hypothetical protein